MAVFKDHNDIALLREAGKRLAVVLNTVIGSIKVGVTGEELNKQAYELIVAGGDVPAFLNYTIEGEKNPYPATLCVSVNNGVVHCIPSSLKKLKEGDIVGLDIGLIHKGIVVDMAKTVAVGEISDEEKRLLEVTQGALTAGINAIRVGGHIGDIGHAIESHVKGTGFSIVPELGGHGVGRKVHEEPFIANFGKVGTGPEIEEGMVLALEPILNQGASGVRFLSDGYTVETSDGSKSAHFEHTIAIVKNGCEVLTAK